MFHFLDQLVSNSVCLLFGAEQVVYNSFIRACLLKTAAAAGNTETEPDSKRAVKTKTMSYKGIKRSVELQSRNSLSFIVLIKHFKSPLDYLTKL